MLKLLDRAAIRERPSLRLLRSESACGLIPAPLSLTVTVRPSLSGSASTSNGPEPSG